MSAAPDFNDKSVEARSHAAKARSDSSAPHSRSQTPPNRNATPLHPDLIDFDPLSRDLWVNMPAKPQSTVDRPSASQGVPQPMHIKLPPRPSEIDGEERPMLRSPRRFSDFLNLAGPSSPPRVSPAGNDIVFHASSPTRDTAFEDLERVRSKDLAPRRRPSHNIPKEQTSVASPASKLTNLVSTTKLAARLRASVDNLSSHVDDSGPSRVHEKGPSEELFSDDPHINHSNPFASTERLAGSYVAPSGAPGFDGRQRTVRRDVGELAGSDTPVHLLNRRPTTTPVLEGSTASKLRPHLPPRQRISSSWSLIFSLDQHGASLATLYRLAEKHAASNRSAGSILIVVDDQGHRFGAFLNGPVEKREGSYYGGGESFLFKLADDGEAKIFKWTGQNQYYALCENSFLSFGGGAGTYGLILDSTFTRNSTATCPTFDNDILCSATPLHSPKSVPFACLGVELWVT